MERTPFRLFTACAAAVLTRAAASDVQSLVQKGLHTDPDIPPLVPNAEVPLKPPKIDKEWLDQFQDAFQPLICHMKQEEDCEQKFKSRDPGGSSDEFDMSNVMKYLQMLFKAVRSEEFMGNMSMLNDGIRAITSDYKKATVSHVEEFMTAALPLETMEQVIPVLVHLFDEQINSTSQYTADVTDLAFKVLDSMPQDMADGMRPMLKLMVSQSAEVMNISLAKNCTAGEVCVLGDDFFFNLTEGLKTVTKMRKMSNSTQKMVPMIQDYLTSMRPEVAPRIVYLIEQFTETSYIGATYWIDIMQSVNTKVKSVVQDKLKCAFPKSAASTAGLCLGLLTALLSFSMSGLLY